MFTCMVVRGRAWSCVVVHGRAWSCMVVRVTSGPLGLWNTTRQAKSSSSCRTRCLRPWDKSRPCLMKQSPPSHSTTHLHVAHRRPLRRPLSVWQRASCVEPTESWGYEGCRACSVTLLLQLWLRVESCWSGACFLPRLLLIHHAPLRHNLNKPWPTPSGSPGLPSDKLVYSALCHWLCCAALLLKCQTLQRSLYT